MAPMFSGTSRPHTPMSPVRSTVVPFTVRGWAGSEVPMRYTFSVYSVAPVAGVTMEGYLKFDRMKALGRKG